ncbi:hypothetical protein P872_21210 [Rhodonellum psychrophilum GCM71 = DSM 17998]|uniref:Uncharacterized protein n=1 Tax=Rhodonellum psychrophilum GCM71 = DSM 17998 TaxID=1123057 RepID=U5BXU6_9BACT|nr:hypothetical protein P872_21210 [Rhodonellum psychrophilum GCM71 = DSM 17998]
MVCREKLIRRNLDLILKPDKYFIFPYGIETKKKPAYSEKKRLSRSSEVKNSNHLTDYLAISG